MSEQPNILIIQADQHRPDCLGAYGNNDIQTPHIDALAQDGVRHDNSFCPYPVCTPSRYSFLSGLYVRQHLGGSNHCTLPSGLPTFPKELRRAGYRTKAVGKMHLTPTYHDVGFDQMLLAEQNGAGRYDDDYHRWLQQEGQTHLSDLMDQEREYRQHAPPEYWDHVGALESDLDEKHHSTTWIAEQALEELATWQEGGQLLMVSFIKPHHPFDPPAPWSRMYNPDALSLLPGYTPAPLPQDLDFSPGYFPNSEMTEAKIRRAMAFYYATISQIDHHVGRMVKSLQERALYDDTIIIYNSDHGDYMGYHHLLLKGNYMYEPLIKVPLIIKFPHQERAGAASQNLVNSIDLAPTLLRQADCPVPATMQGLDLADPAADRDAIFAESGRGQAFMARTHEHKLLLCRRDQQSQFFDLQADPHELTNRYAEAACQGEIDQLRRRLTDWALFDAAAPVHVDEDAPLITGPNVRHPDDGQREDLYDYFNHRVHQHLQKPEQ
ncbi:MAG: sulfatase-like hydrolase/transferase [Candidatus Latescibacteria bacterium]|nr:sulfatase-like hydrolase/transferase [Candidatus Latescibacterota bacterium]